MIKIAISLGSRIRMLNYIVCLIDPSLVEVNPSGGIEMEAQLNGRRQIRLQRKAGTSDYRENDGKGIHAKLDYWQGVNVLSNSMDHE